MIRWICLSLLLLAAAPLAAQPFPNTRCDVDEAPCLAVLGPNAKRSGDRLSLRLGNGRRVSFIGHTRHCGGMVAQGPCFQRVIVGIQNGFAIIIQRFDLGANGTFINLDDGFTIKTPGWPMPSETGQRFVEDTMLADTTEPSKIYRIEGRTLKLEYTFTPEIEDNAPRSLEWRGDTHLAIECPTGREMTLSLKDGQWVLEGSCQ